MSGPRADGGGPAAKPAAGRAAPHPDRAAAPRPAGPTGPTALLVIAKEPVPGRVKTRLQPDVTAEEAAELAAAALADTLEAVQAAPARRRVLVLSGTPGPWLPEPGFEVVAQAGGGLDERLASAFAGCPGPALLIGMDTPQVTPALLAPALGDDAWDGVDAWFGPARDGGFWALGLADPDPRLLRGVPMSTARTGAIQRARLVEAGLRVRDLAELVDADTPATAARVARAAPGSRFAAAWRRCRGGTG
ncbi:DUF2064 domain-containing protein [Streptomonospora sp. PA3]|uniref:TIGR04282 family arsenosugar biosynthesis glycosyltransferase n=1 Tax=Streptomonospora sp. PA3 TaxID=2607326 RepID=UPI0012DE399A|nr:DUF2064 domain-containing protein [Streptomonospora sp. PA3]MUL40727.1 DUF2064 domain-containing protein [Streptomonospora sp. PA3]